MIDFDGLFELYSPNSHGDERSRSATAMLVTVLSTLGYGTLGEINARLDELDRQAAA